MESCLIVRLYYLPERLRRANIESSQVWGTSCLADVIHDLISKHFLCRKCPKPVTIEYLPPARQVSEPASLTYTINSFRVSSRLSMFENNKQKTNEPINI